MQLINRLICIRSIEYILTRFQMLCTQDFLEKQTRFEEKAQKLGVSFIISKYASLQVCCTTSPSRERLSLISFRKSKKLLSERAAAVDSTASKLQNLMELILFWCHLEG